MPRNFTHRAFDHFGSESRARIAFAFIPDPGTEVSIPYLSKLIGKPDGSLSDSVNKLVQGGLLQQSGADEAGRHTYRRIENPMWAVYETARIVFTGMGIEIGSIAPPSEMQPAEMLLPEPEL